LLVEPIRNRVAIFALDKTMVVHHIQNSDTIQVRYIANQQPFADAAPAEPNLEDAYLCLLKGM
jgi:hypothetical protein